MVRNEASRSWTIKSWSGLFLGVNNHKISTGSLIISSFHKVYKVNVSVRPHVSSQKLLAGFR